MAPPPVTHRNNIGWSTICGRRVHPLHHTHDNQQVTCKSCHRVIRKAMNP